MDDITGGTFSITNLGLYGVTGFSPIINPPELAILGIGGIIDTPVVRDGRVVIRPMMNLCLTADHRIVDGVMASRFLQRIVELVENPYLLLT
jgi:pyruvate dehydrogenase E2 component (dihydrolipoamide acetyltransferase)